MKSGGPWNLRGLRPEARAAARDAARRSGMSVGEWLNSVIQPTETNDEESWWSGAAGERPSDRSPRGTREESREREPHHPTDSTRPRRADEPRQESSPDNNSNTIDPYGDRPRHREREQDEPQRHAGTGGGDTRTPHRHRKHRFRGREPDELHSPSAPVANQSHERYHDRPWRLREPEPDDEARWRSRNQGREFQGYDISPPHHRDRDSDDRRIPDSPPDVSQRRPAHAEWRPPERQVFPRGDERPAARRDNYYAEQLEQSRRLRDEQLRAERQRRERELFERAAASVAAEQHRQASIDEAVAEITARQRALDQDRTIGSTRSRNFETTQAEAAPQPRESPLQVPQPSPEPALRPPAPPAEPERVFAPWPDGWRSHVAADTSHSGREAPRATPEPSIDISGLQEQLREMTARIEALRPSSELEKAIVGLRADLAEISRSFAEALPRRALESLENEVRALGQRIDRSRQAGVDTMALAGIERGLGEVREALRGLMPAEGLIGFDDTLKALSSKVDAIGAKDDPDAVQQLEAAMGALRGMISRVASDEALTKVAEDVRALSAKVDDAAGGGSNVPTLAALENRIDILASALSASTEAGHAVPRELEKLLSGLVEKLEQVQLTHTDRAALGHLEDRIAALVRRLDAADARLGLLEGVERGLSDLLVYVEQLRGTPDLGNAAAAVAPSLAAAPVERADALIKQTEPIKRTEQPGTVAVHDDLFDDAHAMMEHAVEHPPSVGPGRRTEWSSAAPSLPQTAASALSVHGKYEERRETEGASTDAVAAESVVRFGQSESTLARPTAARTPIDPSLPPDHPLEPGSTSRSRASSSPAERIAASEAAAGAKPPVITDSGASKPDFIAAARRAAQAATAASADGKRSKSGVAQPKRLTERLRTLAVAAAVVVIVVGGFHIISRLFEDGSGSSVPTRVEPALPSGAPSSQTEPPHTQSAPPQAQPETLPAGKEPPHVEADPLPSTNTMNLLPPVPLPDETSPRSVEPPAAVGVGAASPLASPPQAPGRSDSKAENHATEIVPPVSGVPMDITGSLSHPPSAPSAPASQAATGTAAMANRLPAAIGGQTLRLAALAGDPLAAYEVGVRFSEGRGVPASNEEAARWFEIAANKGIVPAQFRLGTLYEKGLGVKKDLIAARDLYRAAAERGHGKAMHNLAVIYAEGPEGKPDYATAAQWFRKAADHGVTDSQYNLAILYARGVGVEQNLAESYKWFFLAAKEGDQDAAQKRDEIASRIDRAALAAARAAAENWTPIPQPADAITVKGTWDPPGTAPPAAKPKPRSAKATSREASRVN
jgi:localization factor PodJL